MMGRSVAWRVEHGPGSPLDGVAEKLRAADIAVGNLECAMGSGGAAVKKAYVFRAPPKSAELLEEAGIDVVSIANNHILDYGPDVFAQTLDLLGKVKIKHAGAGPNEAAAHEPAIVVARGLRFAFLGYVRVPAEGKNGAGFDTKTWAAKGDLPGLAWADDARIAEDVRAAKTRADHVVVMLHAGNEESVFVSATQAATAHAAVDAGATIVLGHHPHVLQSAERYKKGFIAYSLGNFLFDGKDVLSAVLDLVVDREGVKSFAWTPLYTRGGAPQIV
jgi:poly-gamma-glutamate capsule biosynthesis protein CapA/YwtB (metallophosphatase superfamily)